jgi:uncharacterized protein YjbI with pentapeptide repeats
LKRQRWPAAAKHWRRRRRALRATGEAMPTVVQVPPPWVVMRLAVRMKAGPRGGRIPLLRRIGAGLDWLSSRPSFLLQQSATARFFTELIAVAAILTGIIAAILTAFQFQMELENREEDRVNRAWSLIAAAKQVQGNVGLIEALETLNARQIDMSRLELPGAYLSGVQLESGFLINANLAGADLSHAKLSSVALVGAELAGANLAGANLWGADLPGADLSGANLFIADLSGADLTGANLIGANLRSANLTEAYVHRVELSGANLLGANLSGAELFGDLSGVNNLTQEQLDRACGDERTQLPPGLTVPRCEARFPP